MPNYCILISNKAISIKRKIMWNKDIHYDKGIDYLWCCNNCTHLTLYMSNKKTPKHEAKNDRISRRNREMLFYSQRLQHTSASNRQIKQTEYISKDIVDLNNTINQLALLTFIEYSLY